MTLEHDPDFGVTRVSLGVQSFNDAVRKNAVRQDSGKSVIKKIGNDKKFFSNGTSCDLISGLPLQNEKVLLTDIERVIANGAVHISLYDLITYGAFLPAISAEKKESPLDDSEAELDESYFGAKRVRGKRSRGAAGKTPVFGLLKRGGKVFVKIVSGMYAEYCSKGELMPIIQGSPYMARPAAL